MQESSTKITLKAVYGKQQGALLLSPVKDRVTGRLKGVKELSEDERRKEKRPVTADTQRKISDGLEIDLINEVDQIDWEWIKHCGEIAPSFDDAQSSPKALFYIDQPDKEIEDRLVRKEKKFEAEAYVRNCSTSAREEIARYLGQNVGYMRSQEILDWLLSKTEAKNGPAEILKAKSDPKFKTRLFLYKLMDIGKIKKNSSGIYSFGQIVLGLTLEAAIEWLDSDKNRDIVGRLYIELHGGDDVVTTSVIEEFEASAKKKAEVKNTDGAGDALEDALKTEEVI